MLPILEKYEREGHPYYASARYTPTLTTHLWHVTQLFVQKMNVHALINWQMGATHGMKLTSVGSRHRLIKALTGDWPKASH